MMSNSCVDMSWNRDLFLDASSAPRRLRRHAKLPDEHLAQMAKQERNIGESHSIEEATMRHEQKTRRHTSARS